MRRAHAFENHAAERTSRGAASAAKNSRFLTATAANDDLRSRRGWTRPRVGAGVSHWVTVWRAFGVRVQASPNAIGQLIIM